MFCHQCGSKISDHAKFCSVCGAVQSAGEQPPCPPPHTAPGGTAYAPILTVSPDEPVQDGGRPVSRHVTLCSDGVYRWVYEYSLFRHPGLFFLIWKIFFFIVLGIFAFMALITVFQGDMDGEQALNLLKFLGIFTLGMTVLVGISYLIYAAVMGGTYIAVFEMDENGVNHKQIDRQAKKAGKIADAAVLIGALAGSRAAMTSGLTMRSEMYTSFGSTGKVRAYPKKNLIKIREALSHNQVFAHPEDFDFVLSYILARVPDKAKPAKKH